MKKEWIMVSCISILLSLHQVGIYSILGILVYTFLRENEEKYILLGVCLLTFLLRGYYMEGGILLLYFAILYILHMCLHNSFSITCISGIMILFIYSIMKVSEVEPWICLFGIISILGLKHREKNEIYYPFLLILALSSILNSEILFSVLLLISAIYIKGIDYVLLVVVCMVQMQGSLIISANTSAIILYVLLSTLSEWLGLCVYILLASTLHISLFEFISYVGVMLLLHYVEKEKHIPSTSQEKQGEVVVLDKLAKIAHEFKDDERMKNFEVALNSCRDALESQQQQECNRKKLREFLEAYKYKIDTLSIEYQSCLSIHMTLYDVDRNEIMNTLLPLLSKFFHTKVYLLDYQKANLLHSYHECTFVVYPYIRLKFDYIQKGIHQVCGDSIHVMKHNEEHEFILSDGMGNGEEARKQSNMVIRLIDELSSIHLPFLNMLKLLNDMMVTQGIEEYATLDLLRVNTITKQAYLYKAGSVDTYLVRDNKVYAFKSESLPIGIISEIAINVFCFKIQIDDVIVMASDGIDQSKIMDWMKEEKMHKTSEIVHNICLKQVQQGMSDDISVLAIKIYNHFQFIV